MDIFIWILGFVLSFIGLFLIFFTEKFLSYDSKILPNFWDSYGKDIVLNNWKSRRIITLIIGIVFLISGLLIFLSNYYFFQARLA